MNHRGRCLLVLCAVWCVDNAWSAAQVDSVERERIAKERDVTEVAFARRERECQTRFIVTSCVEEARRDRREALSQLRRQETVLDEAQRRQRAAQRAEAIRTRISNEELRQPKPSARARGDLEPKLAPSISSKARRAASASPSHPAASGPDRRSQESASQSAFEARKQAAQAHRDAVELRSAQRSAKVKKLALPIPASASAP